MGHSIAIYSIYLYRYGIFQMLHGESELRYFDNCGRACFLLHLTFFAFGRPYPTSGNQNTVKTARSRFSPKRRLVPYAQPLFDLIRPIPSRLRLRVTARRVKNFPFSLISSNSIVYRNHRIYGGSPPLLYWLWWQSTI